MKTNEQFDKRAKDYDKNTVWINSEVLSQKCLSQLEDLVPNANCVDLGGGTGYIPNKDLINGSEKMWTVVDISYKMLKKSSHNKRITFIQEDIEKTSLPSNFFQFAIIRSVLHYTNPSNSLKEALRILKNEGYLVICEKVFDYDQEFLNEYENLVKLRNPNKKQIFKKGDLPKLAKSCGFNILKTDTVIEEYEITLDSFFDRGGTIPAKNKGKILEIIKSLSTNPKLPLFIEDQKIKFSHTWELTYCIKDLNHENIIYPLVMSMIVEKNIENETYILLQKRKKRIREPEFFDYWELPQGKVIYGESLYETAKRELKEETDLDIANFNPFVFKNNQYCLESFDSINIVSIKGLINYYSICIKLLAKGDPRPPILNTEPTWIKVEKLDSFIKNEKIYPLNLPMIKKYLDMHPDTYYESDKTH
jgi:ubiquinone/menaquinone biosynthesis C-methylase UbiE/8-oxo-dGTP pyrophosphatase MutT (NUDIX family)